MEKPESFHAIQGLGSHLTHPAALICGVVWLPWSPASLLSLYKQRAAGVISCADENALEATTTETDGSSIWSAIDEVYSIRKPEQTFATRIS
jgi:hypothetical protein